VSNADRAAVTARSTSAGEETGTAARTSSVAGLCTGMRSVPSGWTHAPPMKIWS
jgi:hypothetical protein